MKISFVLHDTGILPSGGLRVIYEYANHLTEKGHQVNIVYPLIPFIPRPKFSLKKPLDQFRWVKWNWHWFFLNLRRGKTINWFDLKARVVRIPSNMPWARGFSERFIPDADVVLATAWETAYFVNKLSYRKGKKYYFVQHYEIWKVWDEEKLWKKAEELEPDPTKLCLAMHDITPQDLKLQRTKELVDDTYKLSLSKIVISSWLKELMEKKFGQKAQGPVVNGVNFNTFHIDKTMKRETRVLMPWRQAKWKGTEDGLEAFNLVRKRYPEVEFALHGAPVGVELPSWVRKFGRVSDDELRGLYNSSAIYVVPSWVEGSQLPPMEAMACGCAVVATNVGGITDYAIPGETVLISPPRQPEALAKNIIALLEDREKLKRISNAGYEHIKEFSWEKASARLENMLQAKQ